MRAIMEAADEVDAPVIMQGSAVPLEKIAERYHKGELNQIVR